MFTRPISPRTSAGSPSPLPNSPSAARCSAPSATIAARCWVSAFLYSPPSVSASPRISSVIESPSRPAISLSRWRISLRRMVSFWDFVMVGYQSCVRCRPVSQTGECRQEVAISATNSRHASLPGTGGAGNSRRGS